MENRSLRQRCKNRSDFKKEFSEWRKYQLAQGRQIVKAAPSSVLFISTRLKLFKVSSDTIRFKPSGVNAVFERLCNQRQELEADKHGVTVRPE